MTKLEYEKCEKLMEEAIRKIRQADEEYKAYNQLLNEDTIKAETEQRKADQHYGEAVGIERVLAVLDFKNDKMKELSKSL